MAAHDFSLFLQASYQVYPVHHPATLHSVSDQQQTEVHLVGDEPKLLQADPLLASDPLVHKAAALPGHQVNYQTSADAPGQDPEGTASTRNAVSLSADDVSLSQPDASAVSTTNDNSQIDIQQEQIDRLVTLFRQGHLKLPDDVGAQPSPGSFVSAPSPTPFDIQPSSNHEQPLETAAVSPEPSTSCDAGR